MALLQGSNLFDAYLTLTLAWCDFRPSQALNPLILKGLRQVYLFPFMEMEAPPRLELGVKVLQTSALPLGYGATLRFFAHAY